jgi:hypothetical protein
VVIVEAVTVVLAAAVALGAVVDSVVGSSTLGEVAQAEETSMNPAATAKSAVRRMLSPRLFDQAYQPQFVVHRTAEFPLRSLTVHSSNDPQQRV